MATLDVMMWLSKKLLPTGRAFRMPAPQTETIGYGTEDGSHGYCTEDGSSSYISDTTTITGGGFLSRLFAAIHQTSSQVVRDGKNILNSRLPDNSYFTMQDATDWYRRLGMYNSGSMLFTDMKAGLLQKMSFPPVPINMQSMAFIQAQLRLAGFDVYLYKNRFANGSGGFVTYTPSMALGTTAVRAVSGFIESGQGQHGQMGVEAVTVVANYVEEAKDATFNFGSNLRSTFFIAGTTITTFATVPVARKNEFRQLILKYKRCEMAAFLFVNYI